jgi:ATP-binding cassette, subfamily B, bacterial CvaB/MchF/RaxB
MVVRPQIPLQEEPTDCGLVCLKAAAAMFGIYIDIDKLKDQGFMSSRGLRISNMVEVAAEVGLECLVVAFDTSKRPEIKPGTIVLVDEKHYLLVGRARSTYVDVFDPNGGWRWIKLLTLQAKMNGLGIEIAGPTSATPTASAKSRPSLVITQWLQRHRALARTLVRPFVVSLAGIAAMAAIPYLTKLVIDQATGPSAPVSPMSGVSIVLLAGLFGTGITYLSSYVTTRAAADFEKVLSVDLRERLFRLPLSYFGRQPASAIASRFRVLDEIRELALKYATDYLVQVILGIFAIVITFAISPTMALVTIGVWLSALLVRLVLQHAKRDRAVKYAQASLIHDRLLLETIYCMQALQLAGAGETAKLRLSQAHIECLAQQASLDRTNRLHNLVGSIFVSLQGAMILFCGAQLLSNGSLTSGGYVAVSSYAGMVAAAIGAFFQLSSTRHIMAYADGRLRGILRSSDQPRSPNQLTDSHKSGSRVVWASRETPVAGPLASQDSMIGGPPVMRVYANRDLLSPGTTGQLGSIRLEGVSFAYGKFDPYVFEKLTLSIDPGECVAIVSPSGGGKSTLAKMIVGMLRPTSGSLVVNGIQSTDHFDGGIRCGIATVMQNDRLITGSIFDNIDMYRGYSEADVERAAALAEILETIQELPMRLQTLVSEGFDALSGGQRQRILLARALIGNPQILLLDEATSALDSATELRIIDRIKLMKATRVIFTHRPEVIKLADRAVRLPVVAGLRSVRGPRYAA